MKLSLLTVFDFILSLLFFKLLFGVFQGLPFLSGETWVNLESWIFAVLFAIVATFAMPLGQRLWDSAQEKKG
ncbi:hypothetical protein KJY77_02195 [Canibacter sp. lx-72]|uniref:hypothetical protein n=1 Tax=Canibacter zhuwentaonis TaxID=2837491 RepID=UPI001BDBF923|nr:hypothetical protein [Canibacter zhuwentaonis]MBT1017954.1 hypothetical protein [Canibacter zhuwentaonis]